MKLKDLLTVMLFTIFIYFLYIISNYIKINYSILQYYIPHYIWLNIWTLILSILFSIDYIKNWLLPGKLRINFVYFIFSLLILTMYIPETPLFLFFSINKSEILLLVFWFCLLRSFYKKSDLNYLGDKKTI
jgi:hypothetical protein